jgi:hypothetical protein
MYVSLSRLTFYRTCQAGKPIVRSIVPEGETSGGWLRAQSSSAVFHRGLLPCRPLFSVDRGRRPEARRLLHTIRSRLRRAYENSDRPNSNGNERR